MSAADHDADVVISCTPLEPTLRYFRSLGFRLEAIFPADAPRVALLAADGTRVRLQPIEAGLPAAAAPAAQSGVRITSAGAGPAFHPGRAGMLYRDLLPDRAGGQWIASHIRVPDEGPVDDAVHYHHVQLQLIHCLRGWVRVAYEGRRAPIEMRPGDTVLQPPEIRHRVLESGGPLEVVEIACPAEHETWFDAACTLPEAAPDEARTYDGQRFVHHVAAAAAPAVAWPLAGFEAVDTGIGAATGGLAAAHLVRCPNPAPPAPLTTETDTFWFVRAGHATLDLGETRHTIATGDAVFLPAHTTVTLTPDRTLEHLEVTANVRSQAPIHHETPASH